ncbi:hypothetical protein ACLOJK_036562 [Asimina triloba]
MHRRSTRLGAPSSPSRPAAMAAGNESSGEGADDRSKPLERTATTMRFQIHRCPTIPTPTSQRTRSLRLMTQPSLADAPPNDAIQRFFGQQLARSRRTSSRSPSRPIEMG